MRTTSRKLRKLSVLEKKIQELPAPTEVEQSLIDAEVRLDAVYYSNRLEGNKLKKEEAQKAIVAA